MEWPSNDGANYNIMTHIHTDSFREHTEFSNSAKEDNRNSRNYQLKSISYLPIVAVPKQVLFWQMDRQKKCGITNKKYRSKLNKEKGWILISWRWTSLWRLYSPQISPGNQRTLNVASSTIIGWCHIDSTLHVEKILSLNNRHIRKVEKGERRHKKHSYQFGGFRKQRIVHNLQSAIYYIPSYHKWWYNFEVR